MSNSKYRFKYQGLEVYDRSVHDRPYYCHFIVTETATGNVVVDFYTNKVLEGLFLESSRDGTYDQVLGTCQFSLPSTKSGCRNRLKKMALMALEDDSF